MAKRLAGNPKICPEFRNAYGGVIPPVLIHTEITAPMRLKKPARIGVQFMGDLFHEDVPDEFIMRVFDSIEMRKKFQETLARKREEKESSPTDKLAQKERKRAADRDYHRKKRAEKKPKSGNSKSETRLVLAKTFPCPNCGAQLMIHE
jgi:hypothetical protein